jgi:acyl dehydratase
MFRERIAHGMFSGALISAAVACTLPGPGTIYLGQQMSFQKPVKIGDTLTVRLEILEKLPKFKVRIATNVYNQNDELVVQGEAEILAPRKQQTVELVSEFPPDSWLLAGKPAPSLFAGKPAKRRYANIIQ